MKTAFMILLFTFLCCAINAQESVNEDNASAYKGKFYNKEYNIYLVINLSEKNILVPGQEVLGELDGYFGSTQTSHIWAITSSTINEKNATIEVVNNYGSEDFIASITIKDNETLEFKHLNGSTFKFPVNNKWQKIPSKILLSICK